VTRSPSAPTLAAVAAHAGVSLATASRALHGSGSRTVTPALREQVLASASELGYVANAHAQALAGARTSTVGVLVHDVSDPYYATIARGVMRAASERGMLVLMAATHWQPEHELAYVATLQAQRASAVLLAGSGFEQPAHRRRLGRALREFAAMGGGVACIGDHGVPVDTLVLDNREGAAALARRLLELGHRRFAVVSGPLELTTVRERVGGFRDALAEAGVELADRDVADGRFTREGAAEAIGALLDAGTSASAIFALTDVMAVSVHSTLRGRGVAVPDDISLAGFDDVPLLRDVMPGLTTVRLPLEAAGERALELALARGAPRRRRTEHLAGEVVVRESTRAV
jgi:LacI family transcriptional regulator